MVDDVDAHFRRASRSGATILQEPSDTEYGQRRYGAADPEGMSGISLMRFAVRPGRGNRSDEPSPMAGLAIVETRGDRALRGAEL